MTRLAVEVPGADAPERLAIAPSLEEVRARVGHAGEVPLVHTYLADLETPVSAYLKLRGGGPAFLLESAEQGQRVGRYSMIGIRPKGVLRTTDGITTLHDADGTHPVDAPDAFAAVEQAVRRARSDRPPTDLAFWGGAVGFFGYDLVRSVERLPNVPPDDRELPDMVSLLTGPVIVFDHVGRTLTIVAPCQLEGEADPATAYSAACDEIAAIKQVLSGPIPAQGDREAPVCGPVEANMTQADFEAAVERCREYIFAGDAFQIVPSQRFSAATNIDPFAIYRGLRAVNPSPYMYFLELGDLTLVGSSPETLVKVTGTKAETHPIAGSRPRGADDDEDDALRSDLLADPKERAEHVMLVDLGRNDLGRVAEVGTVHVSDLMRVGLYSHVMHIESRVVATLAEGASAVDALRATFPAGTLSGAPKVRAMEIIDELEPTKRGPYGGAVGYLGHDGDLDTCITIRTFVCRDGVVHAQAGAGIVADSVPEREHQECENKAAALFRALEVAAGERW